MVFTSQTPKSTKSGNELITAVINYQKMIATNMDYTSIYIHIQQLPTWTIPQYAHIHLKGITDSNKFDQTK